ncbi:hypothetical protein ILUMI_25940 [Ignelater luminosus]|uniref:Uncharacterized protein n=1 Tax=Ignelater luminosus TaxID=2038154 RepID=A0A8K0FZ58_IGNLU|nr:hypothetical protein ILUMI_25940 [Ignelater luminosus]
MSIEEEITLDDGKKEKIKDKSDMIIEMIQELKRFTETEIKELKDEQKKCLTEIQELKRENSQIKKKN